MARSGAKTTSKCKFRHNYPSDRGQSKSASSPQVPIETKFAFYRFAPVPTNESERRKSFSGRSPLCEMDGGATLFCLKSFYNLSSQRLIRSLNGSQKALIFLAVSFWGAHIPASLVRLSCSTQQAFISSSSLLGLTNEEGRRLVPKQR